MGDVDGCTDGLGVGGAEGNILGVPVGWLVGDTDGLGVG